MKITVLCKVVDNFGDIGVAYRLVKQLKLVNPSCEIFLVVDDLVSFNKINHTINPQLDFQKIEGIEVYNWKSEKLCHDVFFKNKGEKLEFILELFQCGRPDWLEKILFEEKLEKTVNIIMIDYLSAEKYAEDFHCLQSLTRSARVQKINFMPGFTEKTGGLIIDENWKQMPEYNKKGDILFFCYDRNWTPLKNAVVSSENLVGKKILVAQGKGKQTFLTSKITVKENIAGNNNLNIEELPFLNQEKWDEIMKNCSILFIRGEETLSRACISGIPFIWHAYPQSDEYQMVKVNALLERMRSCFTNKDFELINDLMIIFNLPDTKENAAKMETLLISFFARYDTLASSYRNFAESIRKNGDLAANLMTFIEKKYIKIYN